MLQTTLDKMQFKEKIVSQNKIGDLPSDRLSDISSQFEIDHVIIDRVISERVFANKNLNFDEIKAVGFDMDYTVAQYTDEYYKLQFDLALNNLIKLFNYPIETRQIQFDPHFAVKGLFVDTLLGNVLKIDQFGYIHQCLHGKTRLSDAEIKRFYKDKTIAVYELEQSRRYYLQSNAFATPLITLFASLIDYFEGRQAVVDPISQQSCLKLQYSDGKNWSLSQNQLVYINLFDDINEALRLIHDDGAEMKQTTVRDPGRFIVKSDKLKQLFRNLHESGKVTYLITNSSYWYTHEVLNFLFDGDYFKYFDYVITDAQKPSFFTGQTSFREVVGGNKCLTQVGSALQRGRVYAGGNYRELLKMLCLKAQDTLYCGDHIVGDTAATKDQQMRTLFIIPELVSEIRVQEHIIRLYEQLYVLEQERERQQMQCAAEGAEHAPADLKALNKQIEDLQIDIDLRYNKYFGSTFNSYWGKTWLSQYMEEKSDLYTGELVNLANYSGAHVFMANHVNALPHIQEKMAQIQEDKKLSYRLIPSALISAKSVEGQ